MILESWRSSGPSKNDIITKTWKSIYRVKWYEKYALFDVKWTNLSTRHLIKNRKKKFVELIRRMWQIQKLFHIWLRLMQQNGHHFIFLNSNEVCINKAHKLNNELEKGWCSDTRNSFWQQTIPFCHRKRQKLKYWWHCPCHNYQFNKAI